MPRCSLDAAASTVSEASSTWPAALRVSPTALVTWSSTPTNPFAPYAALATLSEISTHDHHRGEALDDRHGVYLPALQQDYVQANPPPERGKRYTVASLY